MTGTNEMEGNDSQDSKHREDNCSNDDICHIKPGENEYFVSKTGENENSDIKTGEQSIIKMLHQMMKKSIDPLNTGVTGCKTMIFITRLLALPYQIWDYRIKKMIVPALP